MPKETWTEYRAMDAFRARRVEPGDLLRPWLAAGPFFTDLSAEVPGRSFFEAAEGGMGEDVFRRHVEQAERCLVGSPAEGTVLECFGEREAYRLMRAEEPMMSWGRYGVYNTFVAMFFSTRVTPERAGPARLRFRVASDNQICVAVNGQVRYRSFGRVIERAGDSWGALRLLEVELAVDEGENVLTLGAFRMGRVARGGLSVEAADGPLTVRAPFAPLAGGLDRAAVEGVLQAVYPTREWFYPEDSIRVMCEDPAPALDAELRVCLKRGGRELRTERAALAPGAICVASGADLGPGPFVLETALVAGQEVLARREFSGLVLTRPAPVRGPLAYDERRQAVLEHFAHHDDLWGQVARYALGRFADIAAEPIRKACDHIRARFDCADFVMHPLLRLLCMDRDRNRLGQELRDLVTETCLGFKYWTDEPGSDCLVTGTENHQILFHAAEILAGSLWPEETFTNSGMSGRDHVEKGIRLARPWLVTKGREGFREWHSSSYYPLWIMPLLNLFDFAPQEANRVRELAGNLLTVGLFNLAQDSYHGVLATSHGRIYAPLIKVPDLDGCGALNWMLGGEGHLGSKAKGAVELATSRYRPPDLLLRVAAERDSVMLSRTRQGSDANFIVYRTPDYQLSVLQDYRPGERAAQVHPFQLTFEDHVVLFFSCPDTSGEGNGLRPDYWSGNAFLPRAFGERNVAVLLFRPGELGWISHGYFERDRFDEVTERNGWLFARKNAAYVGIWSEHGSEIGRTGQYAGRELICRAPENAWIVEAGRGADWGGFESFVGALGSIRPQRRGPVGSTTLSGRRGTQLVYPSPSVGTIRMGWEGPIFLGDSEVDTCYPLLDSPYAESEHRSGRIVLRHGGEQVELVFEQSEPTSEAKVNP